MGLAKSDSIKELRVLLMTNPFLSWFFALETCFIELLSTLNHHICFMRFVRNVQARKILLKTLEECNEKVTYILYRDRFN
jgi:hypothetical protein